MHTRSLHRVPWPVSVRYETKFGKMGPKPILDHPYPSIGNPRVGMNPDSGLQVRQDKVEGQRGWLEYTAQNRTVVFRLVCRKGCTLNVAQSHNASALVDRWFVLISSRFRLFWNVCRRSLRPSSMICPQCLVRNGSKATVTLVTKRPDRSCRRLWKVLKGSTKPNSLAVASHCVSGHWVTQIWAI